MATNYNLTKLGDSLKAAAKQINQRVHDDITSLSFEEIQDLSDQSQDLLIKARSLYEMAAIDIADNGKTALDQLANAQKDILKAIKTIKTVQTVINITAKIIGLAGSIITGNFGGIVSTAKEIIDLVK